MSPQNRKLLDFLESHPDGISQLEAFNTLGCTRISERVRELERPPYNYPIEHQPERTASGARVIRYRLERFACG